MDYIKEYADREYRTVYFTQVPEIFNIGFVYNVCLGNIELVRFLLLSKKEHSNKLSRFNVLFYLIQEALYKANIIHKFEKKTRYKLDKLSAGEKQRLQFARLFFSNPDVMVLDECFSNLDFYNQKIIAKQLKEFRKERTMMLISHSHDIISLMGEKKVYEIT